MKRGSIPAASAAGILIFSTAWAQVDPGIRGGAINGQPGATPTNPLPLASVAADNTSGIQDFFKNGLSRFQEQDVVANGDSNGFGNGLGPRFNLNQCSGCHGQPTIGGTGLANNPQFTAVSTGMAGPGNTIPSFLLPNGPTREARFPFFFNSNGTVNTNAPNGGVETLFTVTGLSFTAGCTLSQPNFAAAQAANNIIFRIPTPVFGAGLVENIDDSTLIAVQTASAANSLGISGTFNRNGNDGTIARFGWKAQNKSLLLFAGEAYNVEMGISNELFPQDRPLPEEEARGTGLPPGCLNLTTTGYPEDITNFAPADGTSGTAANATILSDAEAFAQFMRLLAPPVQSTTTPGGATSIANGRRLFSSVGCAVCHTPTINRTQASHITPSLDSQPVAAFSDFEIHHMGTRLADNVSQGTAGGDQFRTAPLWGLGQRIFFMHDGSLTSVYSAIDAHRSNGSEASQVITNFFNLSTTQQQDVLNFLRSL
jgi:CxxC motif-containing protein (DUF1111 family)